MLGRTKCERSVVLHAKNQSGETSEKEGIIRIFPAKIFACDPYRLDGLEAASEAPPGVPGPPVRPSPC